MRNGKLRVGRVAASFLSAIFAAACPSVFAAGCGGGNSMEDSGSGKGSDSSAGSKTAKVIVISGQSNASGFTWWKYLKKYVSQEKYAQYEQGFDHAMIYYNVDTAEKNGYSWGDGGDNTSSGEFVKVKIGQGHTKERFGMEIGIAERLAEVCPDKTVYLIKCAWGSASLFNDFASPSMVNYPTSVYYDKLISVVHEGLSKLTDITGVSPQIGAFCWMQGEKDSAYYAETSQYGPNLEKFVGDFRKEFSEYAGKNGIPFLDAKLAGNEHWTYGEYVNQHKAWFAEKAENNYLVETEGLIYSEEPEEKPDPYHFDSRSMLQLGYRFADIIKQLL